MVARASLGPADEAATDDDDNDDDEEAAVVLASLPVAGPTGVRSAAAKEEVARVEVVLGISFGSAPGPAPLTDTPAVEDDDDEEEEDVLPPAAAAEEEEEEEEELVVVEAGMPLRRWSRAWAMAATCALPHTR